MDSNRFDNWTRNRALRLSRRDALRLAGAGGATAALGSRRLDSLAQTSCKLTVHGKTTGGPSASTTYDGTLTYMAGADGTLSQGSFTPTGGAPTATCTDGACACQVDGLPCTKHFDCCSDSCLSSGVCGCAMVGTDCSSGETICCGRDEGATACVSGICRYLDGTAACFSDNECITGICKNGACASCLDPLEAPCTRDAECCNYNGKGCVNGVCPQ